MGSQKVVLNDGILINFIEQTLHEIKLKKYETTIFFQKKFFIPLQPWVYTLYKTRADTVQISY